MNIDIKLGSTVCDVTTGLTGYAIQKIEFFNGNVQYAVQPQGDGKTMPDRRPLDSRRALLRLP